MDCVSCDRKRLVGRRTDHHGRDRAARKIGVTSMTRVRRDDRRAGFTLIEALAALAVGSVIIMATAALIHDVARHFDRGTRGAQEAERLMLAVERLAQDFNSARFVGWATEGGPAVAVAAGPASRDQPAKGMFVGNAGIMAGPPGGRADGLTCHPPSAT